MILATGRIQVKILNLANIFSGHTNYYIKLRMSLYMYVFGCGECITERAQSYESSLLLSVCTALEDKRFLYVLYHKIQTNIHQDR